MHLRVFLTRKVSCRLQYWRHWFVNHLTWHHVMWSTLETNIDQKVCSNRSKSVRNGFLVEFYVGIGTRGCFWAPGASLSLDSHLGSKIELKTEIPPPHLMKWALYHFYKKWYTNFIIPLFANFGGSVLFKKWYNEVSIPLFDEFSPGTTIPCQGTKKKVWLEFWITLES